MWFTHVAKWINNRISVSHPHFLKGCDSARIPRSKSYYPNTSFIYAYTILPEIFARVLCSLNFALDVGPRKLRARNFLRTRKFWLRGIHNHLHAVWFPRRCGAVTSLIFLLFLTSSWRGLSFDTCSWFQINARVPESSYLTAKLASSDLLFVERSVCQANSHYYNFR